MITQIEVKKLFNIYNHTINLNPNITILHGPNGVGKTTILQMLDDMFNQEKYYLTINNWQPLGANHRTKSTSTLKQAIESLTKTKPTKKGIDSGGETKINPFYFSNYHKHYTKTIVLSQTKKFARKPPPPHCV